MDYQKSADQQHSSHNLLCALVKFLYLSGPPLLGRPQGEPASTCGFLNLCFRVHRGGQGGALRKPLASSFPHPPTQSSLLLLILHIKSPREFSFEEALVV